MKKRFGIISMIVVLLVCFAVCFTACGSKDKGNGDSINIADDYNYAQIEAKINEMAGTNGVFVKVRVSSSSSGEADETYYVAFGVNNHIYYYKTETTEAIYDLSDNTKGVVYEKNDAGTWDKDIYYYGTSFTKENMDAYANALSTGVFGWLGYYHYLGAGEGTKSDTTFLNRSCTKYSISTNYVGYGASYSQEVIIDKETGACLKYAASATAGGESGSVSIECTEFNTSWNPSIPTNIASTEEHGTQGQGGSGGSGTGGQGGTGGSGNGEGGQGGSGGSGEGGQGGQGGSGEGEEDRGPFYGKRLSVTSVNISQNHAYEALFENAYAQLYDNHNFELISDAGCLLGNYVVGLNTAYLNTIKIYANGEYDYETPESMNELELVYDSTNSSYSLEFNMRIESQLVTVEMDIVAEDRLSGHDNDVCPLDPNEYGYDPIYQVTAEVWNGIFKGDYLFEDLGNFTVNYSVESQVWPYSGKFEVDGDVFNDADLQIHERISWTPDQDGQYTFNEYYSDGNGNWMQMSSNGYFDLIDHWDTYTGAIPADFMKAGYNSVSHKYYINSFSYTPVGGSEVSITNFGAWFSNGLLIKVQYTKNGETFTFNYSNFGTTEVEVPTIV